PPSDPAFHSPPARHAHSASAPVSAHHSDAGSDDSHPSSPSFGPASQGGPPLSPPPVANNYPPARPAGLSVTSPLHARSRSEQWSPATRKQMQDQNSVASPSGTSL